MIDRSCVHNIINYYSCNIINFILLSLAIEETRAGTRDVPTRGLLEVQLTGSTLEGYCFMAGDKEVSTGEDDLRF